MYRHCNTEETVRRQRQLEQCLLDAMLTRPYEDISVALLCREARISRVAFYQYFDTKDDALDALLDHTLQEAMAFPFPQTGDPQELHRFVRYWPQHPQLLRVLGQNRLESRLAQRCLALIRSEEPVWCRSLKRRAGECWELHLGLLVEGTCTVLFGWQRQGFHTAPDQVAQLICKVMP